MTERYVPMHHPLCACELCMLLANDRMSNEATQRRAVAYLQRHGRPVRPFSAPEMDGLVGKTVHFQWAHRTPDLSGSDSAAVWNNATEAHAMAVDRGAVLLDPKHARPRWWPFKAFAWIEALDHTWGQ